MDEVHIQLSRLNSSQPRFQSTLIYNRKKTLCYVDEIQCHFLENLLTITPNVVFEIGTIFRIHFLIYARTSKSHIADNYLSEFLKYPLPGNWVLCYSAKKLGKAKTQRKGMGGRGSTMQPPNINFHFLLWIFL